MIGKLDNVDDMRQPRNEYVPETRDGGFANFLRSVC